MCIQQLRKVWSPGWVVIVAALLAAQGSANAVADSASGGYALTIQSKQESQPPASDPYGVTRLDLTGIGTKNAAAPAMTAVSGNAGPLIIGDTNAFMACGASGNANWTTTSTAWQVVRSCSATLPAAGFVFINATAGLGLSDAAYEGRFGLSIDNSTSGLAATSRWVNIYTDSGDGTDKNVALSFTAGVPAGTHTFYLLATRYSGSGTVLAYDPALSVAYFPTSPAQVLSCSESSATPYTTTSSIFGTVRSCALNVPSAGWVYVNASASASYADGPYEARYHVAVDNNALGTGWPDRWVNVYADSGDGTDEALASSMLTQVAAGARTFYFGASRYAGTGTVQLLNTVLNVLYFPDNNVVVKTCGQLEGSGQWQTTSSSFTTVQSCALELASDGFAIVDLNASAGLVYGSTDWEGDFRWGMDSATGSADFDRFVNVYADGGDGSDRLLANSGLVSAPAGTHTFYFVANRYSGTGTVGLIRPTLTVLAPRGQNLIFGNGFE